MNEIEGLSLIGQTKPVNQDIIITYTPKDTVVSYNYDLYKNNKIIDTYNSSTNKKASIIMDETGVYKIVVNEVNLDGSITSIKSGTYNIDKEKPVIKLGEKVLTMQKGDKLDLFSDVECYDNIDGNITNKITTNYKKLDFNTLGIKKLVYTVSDEAGNVTTETININVVDSVSNNLVYAQFGIISSLIIALFLLISFVKSARLERRISRFSIRPLKDNSQSILDSFNQFYHKMVSKVSNIIKSSVLVKKYSQRFSKYLPLSNNLYDTEIDFVASKIVVSFLFLLIYIFSKTLQYKVINSYELFIPILIGFFVLDIIYFSKYKIYRRKLENDLLQAIIIMNNAFKSGRSITQAIDLVTTELEGPIAHEFKKMSMELNFGLSIDIVFSRLSKRIDLEEVSYLTASLSILNKTGGNIIKVFSSIEKSLFNKKKLKLELKALISSSKLIVYVLFLVPLFFIALVSIINPSYFLVFFTNPIGLILLMFMIIYYIIYIIVVTKVMKVRM